MPALTRDDLLAKRAELLQRAEKAQEAAEDAVAVVRRYEGALGVLDELVASTSAGEATESATSAEVAPMRLVSEGGGV